MELRKLLLGASILAFTVGSAYAGEGNKNETKDQAAKSSQTKQKSKASDKKAATGSTAKKEDAKKDTK